jgi:nucleotide-binding universal stress UspA family protein
MRWKQILIGVDDSPQAAAAAALGARLAQSLGGECIPVHAVREWWVAFADDDLTDHAAELRASLADQERREVAGALAGHLPEDVIRRMIVRSGRPAVVLRDVARELGADLIVLGGKHHSTLSRWVGGSTALDAVRSAGLPVLVTAQRSDDGVFRCVIAAVDTSDAAAPTAALAREVAAALGAELIALSVIEPARVLPGITGPLTEAEHSHRVARALEQRVWPLFGEGEVETLTRCGHVVDVIQQAAAQRGADLVVVGSHGKGWRERVLLGSVTERLLNHLPTSLLVVPVEAPPGAAAERRARESAGAHAGR